MIHVCFNKDGVLIGTFNNIEEAKFYCSQGEGSFCVSMTPLECYSFCLRRLKQTEYARWVR